MGTIQILIFICLMVVGSFIGYRLRIPMGAILGAMVFVGAGKALSILTLASSTPLSFLVQTLLGIMIGLSFNRLTKKQFIEVRNSLIFVIVSVIVMTLTTGYMISFFPMLSRSIAFLSSAPGGMVEMATMANALGLEAPSVIFLHFIRLLLVMLIFPQIIKYSYYVMNPAVKPSINKNIADRNSDKQENTVRKYYLLLLVAGSGAFLGYFTQFPIGTLLGSLTAVIIVNFKTGWFRPLSTAAKRGIQTLVGGNIGLSFSSETFLMLPKLMIPALVVTVLTIAFSLALSFILSRTLHVDFLTALCGLAPAGMSEMVIISEQFNVNISTVVTMHLFRIITIVTIIPIIVYNLT